MGGAAVGRRVAGSRPSGAGPVQYTRLRARARLRFPRASWTTEGCWCRSSDGRRRQAAGVSRRASSGGGRRRAFRGGRRLASGGVVWRRPASGVRRRQAAACGVRRRHLLPCQSASVSLAVGSLDRSFRPVASVSLAVAGARPSRLTICPAFFLAGQTGRFHHAATVAVPHGAQPLRRRPAPTVPTAGCGRTLGLKPWPPLVSSPTQTSGGLVWP